MLVGPGDILVPANTVTTSPALDRAPLGVIVFPRYRRRSRFHLEPLSPAQTGLRLMECALNSRSLPDHGFGEVARLANTVPGYELRYANVGQIETNLDALRSLVSAPRIAEHADVSGVR